MKLEYKWHCPICNKNFESRRKLQKHRADEHNGEKVSKVKQLTGLTQRELENTLEHFNAEFEGKYFKRKYNK